MNEKQKDGKHACINWQMIILKGAVQAGFLTYRKYKRGKNFGGFFLRRLEPNPNGEGRKAVSGRIADKAPHLVK